MRDLSALPKAHLHVHLESTVRWSTLREIGAANGVAVPEPPAGGERPFADFRAFADHGSLIRACLRRPADFTRIAAEFCADEAAQGTRYAEVTFTAASHGERLGDPEMPLASVLNGLAAGGAAHGIECRVVLDHSRRRSVERAWATLRLARRFAADGVVAIGMAGDEAHPIAPFAEVLAAAADAGIRRVHHAGETGGPAAIREAIGIGRAERIGHGIRVLEDPALVDEVRDRGIPLEVCPSSNVALSLVDSYAAHPLPALRAAGLAVTLNTDVPSVTGTTLTGEFARMRAVFGATDADLAALAEAGIDASFAPAPVKARLRGLTAAWLAAPAA